MKLRNLTTYGKTLLTILVVLGVWSAVKIYGMAQEANRTDLAKRGFDYSALEAR